jgi:DNA-binding IclR family transcriptional regulator
MSEILDIKEPASEKNSVQVIARAAAILRAIHEEGGGLSLAQIALRVGLPRSTVQRIVNALEAERLLIAATPNGQVVIGPAILRLASSVSSAFVDLVRPRLTRLSADLRETVDLAVIKKDRLIFMDQVVGSQRLRTVSAVGESFPLYCTANGKAYLASLSDRSVERLLGRTFEARTPSTITSLDRLLAELATIRASGVATDQEEHTLGICAAGIAVSDHLGNPHAISVPVPASRFPFVIDEVRGRLLEIKEELIDLVGSLR